MSTSAASSAYSSPPISAFAMTFSLAAALAASLDSSPCPLPQFAHLPHFQWCGRAGPPLFGQRPLALSIADEAFCGLAGEALWALVLAPIVDPRVLACGAVPPLARLHARSVLASLVSVLDLEQIEVAFLGLLDRLLGRAARACCLLPILPLAADHGSREGCWLSASDEQRRSTNDPCNPRGKARAIFLERKKNALHCC
eukprot:scaffold54120_cov51-Phaeocystis_antarctica.AAC.2